MPMIDWSGVFSGTFGAVLGVFLGPLISEFFKAFFEGKKQEREAEQALAAAAANLELAFLGLEETLGTGGSPSDTMDEFRALMEFARAMAAARGVLSKKTVSLAALTFEQCRQNLADIDSGQMPPMLLGQASSALPELYRSLGKAVESLWELQSSARQETGAKVAPMTRQ